MLAASTWLVTSAPRTGPGSPAFSEFPPLFQLSPDRSWFVTSGRPPRVAPLPTSPDLDARLAASDHRLSPVRDPFFVEPALTGCDALVDTPRVHTAAVSPDAGEMNNDTRCSAPSSASHHRLATPAPPHRHPGRHRHDGRWIHHRRRGSPVSWLSRIHSPPRGGSGADRPLWWQVAGKVKDKLVSERAQVEGCIGSVKSRKYGFNKPAAKSAAGMGVCGQRSVLGFNLNKLMNGLADRRRVVLVG